jgi:hypothetical protein
MPGSWLSRRRRIEKPPHKFLWIPHLKLWVCSQCERAKATHVQPKLDKAACVPQELNVHRTHCLAQGWEQGRNVLGTLFRFCTRCGLYATVRLRGLRQPCPGPRPGMEDGFFVTSRTRKSTRGPKSPWRVCTLWSAAVPSEATAGRVPRPPRRAAAAGVASEANLPRSRSRPAGRRRVLLPPPRHRWWGRPPSVVVSRSSRRPGMRRLPERVGAGSLLLLRLLRRRRLRPRPFPLRGRAGICRLPPSCPILRMVARGGLNPRTGTVFWPCLLESRRHRHRRGPRQR